MSASTNHEPVPTISIVFASSAEARNWVDLTSLPLDVIFAPYSRPSTTACTTLASCGFALHLMPLCPQLLIHYKQACTCRYLFTFDGVLRFLGWFFCRIRSHVDTPAVHACGLHGSLASLTCFRSHLIPQRESLPGISSIVSNLVTHVPWCDWARWINLDGCRVEFVFLLGTFGYHSIYDTGQGVVSRREVYLKARSLCNSSSKRASWIIIQFFIHPSQTTILVSLTQKSSWKIPTNPTGSLWARSSTRKPRASRKGALWGLVRRVFVQKEISTPDYGHWNAVNKQAAPKLQTQVFSLVLWYWPIP